MPSVTWKTLGLRWGGNDCCRICSVSDGLPVALTLTSSMGHVSVLALASSSSVNLDLQPAFHALPSRGPSISQALGSTHAARIPLPAPARQIWPSVGSDVPSGGTCAFMKNEYEENTTPLTWCQRRSR